MKTISEEHREALKQVATGADVYNYGLAKSLRAIQKEHPELIDIGKPQMYKGTGVGVVPYFGAICTPAGLKAISPTSKPRKRTKAKPQTK